MGKERKWKLDPQICRDPEKAEEYNALAAQLYENIYHTNSRGQEIFLLSFPVHIKRLTEGLPQEEVEEIYAMYHAKQKLRVKVMGLKRLALQTFGKPRKEAENTLLEPMRAQILEWYGQLYSDSEVAEKFAEGGMPISMEQLKRFKQRHHAEIDKLQEEYNKQWHTIGITRKRSRLDQYAYMFDRSKKEFDEKRGSQMLPFSKEMREILLAVKKEVEGDHVYLTVDGKIDINTTVQMSQNVEELYSNINFLSLLLAKVAARMRIDPLKLQYYLHNSWYARFSGVIGNQKMFDEQPDYPSKIALNWNTIAENYKQKQGKMENIKGIEEAQIIEGPAKKSLREIMQQRAGNLEKAKESLDGRINK